MSVEDFELDIQLSSEETEEKKDSMIPDYTNGTTCSGAVLLCAQLTEPCAC